MVALAAHRQPWGKLFTAVLVAAFLLLPTLDVLLPHLPLIWLYGGLAVLTPLAWLAYGLKPHVEPLLVGLLALAVVWGMATALWSFSPPDAAWNAVRTGATVLVGLLLADLAGRLPPDVALKAARATLPGLALGLLFLAEEKASGLLLLEAIWGSEFNPRTGFDQLNRGVFALVLHGFAPALLLWAIGRCWLAVAVLAALVVTTLFFHSQAAIVAGVLGLLVTAVALWRPRAGAWLLLGLLALLLFGSLPAAKLIAEAGWIEASWLEPAAQARVHVWNFTADRILEQPWFGWGVDAARRMPNFGVEPFLPYETHVIPLHPHNEALQLWLEAGLVGLLLVAGFLFLLWRRAAPTQPGAAFLYGLSAAILVGAGLSFGLWQSRWLALLILVLLQVKVVQRALAPFEGRA